MIRAFVFDIYNTLLEVRPPPADAEARWQALCRPLQTGSPAPSLAEFRARCATVIAVEHKAAKARGIRFPEVFWPDIARAVLPALGLLSPESQDDFLYEHAQLERTVRLMPGAREALAELPRMGAILGICSNSQPYTVRELASALAREGLSPKVFDPDLGFWSYRAGFSKPDPGVFAGLREVLAARSIPLTEALLVGDRLDNDIEPACAQGWRAWQLSAAPKHTLGGDWFRLLAFARRSAAGQDAR